MADGLNFSRRLRRTPYTDSVEAAGVRGFSVVNHMLLPKAYSTTVEQDYWHLREHVQLWDVACQRQVEIIGPDAQQLIQWMTPRPISHARVGDCLYLPLIDDTAGLINDPVLLKLSDDHFWLSIADSDVLLFAKGLALGMRLKVTVEEPDVYPLAVQGPKAEALMVSVFGPHIRQLGFFKFGWFEFEGTPQLIARSGYSRQGGFEVYLRGEHHGAALWDTLWHAGQPYNIAPGCPNLIERIEGGLLSYGNEMTRHNNPLEIGLGKYCALDGEVDYLGRKALQRIAENGISRNIRGVQFGGGPCPTCATPWQVTAHNAVIGEVTSAIWSPRLQTNVGLAMLTRESLNAGQPLTVHDSQGTERHGYVSKLPM